MRRIIPLIGGFAIGFAIIAAAVSAGALFVLGVGGGLLVRRDQSTASNISYDPSTVAARSPFPAAIALILLILFIAFYVRLRRREHDYARALTQQMQTPGGYPGVERRQSMQVPPRG